MSLLNSLWRVPLILAWTGVLATLSVALSPLDDSGALQHACARTWSRFIFFVSRVRLEISGLECIDPERSYIFAANHLSMFDHWAFLACLPMQLRFAAKASLFRIPFLGWHLRRSGNIPVHRHNHRETLRAFKQAAGMVARGVSVVIYPEGGRTLGDEVGPFKRGSLVLTRYTRVPVVPVTIIGAHRRLERGSMIIHSGSMRMIFHTPVEFEDYRNLDLESLADRVRASIAGSYRQVPS